MRKPVMVSTGINTDSFVTGYKSNKLEHKRYVKHLKIDDDQITAFYNMGELIGQGNFGTVYEVKDIKDRQVWAMKIIVKIALSSNTMKQLEREIHILKILSHPHIIGLREVFESPKRIYLVVEMCTCDLAKELKKTKQFNETNTKRIIHDLTSAVSYLHKNDIVHRDIKLENILLTHNPQDKTDKLFIKLTDFGLSIIKTGHGYTDMLHERCGTLYYMAPEILITQSYSQQCDVWAIGVIMYILVTGLWPFMAQNDQDTIEKICYNEPHFETINVSLECKDLMMKILNKNPAARITASEMMCHPWMLGKKLDVCSTSYNILDMMRMWNNKDLRAPITEDDFGVCLMDNKPGVSKKAEAKEEGAKSRRSSEVHASNMSFNKQQSSKHRQEKAKGQHSATPRKSPSGQR